LLTAAPRCVMHMYGPCLPHRYTRTHIHVPFIQIVNLFLAYILTFKFETIWLREPRLSCADFLWYYPMITRAEPFMCRYFVVLPFDYESRAFRVQTFCGITLWLREPSLSCADILLYHSMITKAEPFVCRHFVVLPYDYESQAFRVQTFFTGW
jgi:hypothetical protein